MFRWQTVVGVLAGLALGSAILAFTTRPESRPPPSGPILSECSGHFRELVMQYEPAAHEIVTTAYRQFLGALEPDVTVDVLCPDQSAFEDFQARIETVHCRLRAVIAGHPITTWSRDRWVALAPASAGGPVTLLSPRGEAGNEIWAARAGDECSGSDLARALKPAVSAQRTGLYFDGGDFLTDDDRVFIMPRVLPRNIQHTVTNREQLLTEMRAEFRRPVVLLDEAPDHHAGMFMASVGDKTMLVGDPSLGAKFIPASAGITDSATNEWMNLPGGPDFRPETQHLFDAVAAQCAATGYRVIRIPVVPARDGKTYLTYVNVLMDRQGARRIVYLPFYQGSEALNAAGRAVWESLGFEIRPVDCTDTYRHFGCLHCLVNVLRRS